MSPFSSTLNLQPSFPGRSYFDLRSSPHQLSLHSSLQSLNTPGELSTSDLSSWSLCLEGISETPVLFLPFMCVGEGCELICVCGLLPVWGLFGWWSFVAFLFVWCEDQPSSCAQCLMTLKSDQWSCSFFSSWQHHGWPSLCHHMQWHCTARVLGWVEAMAFVWRFAVLLYPGNQQCLENWISASSLKWSD